MIRAALALAILAAPLAACGVAGIGGFDRDDGRWVADIGPRPGCCPARLVFDVDGHKINGTLEDCSGVKTVLGRIDKQGGATLRVGAATAPITFAGPGFTAPLPGDMCARIAHGNRGD